MLIWAEGAAEPGIVRHTREHRRPALGVLARERGEDGLVADQCAHGPQAGLKQDGAVSARVAAEVLAPTAYPARLDERHALHYGYESPLAIRRLPNLPVRLDEKRTVVILRRP